MDCSTLLSHCAAYLVARKLYVNPSAQRQHIYNTILDGLTILANCHDEWLENHKEHEGSTSLGNIMARIKHCLTQVLLKWQFCFWRLLEAFQGALDWVGYDENVVDIQNFEISATIWFSQMDPLELALGWVQGRSNAELALAAEQAWLGDGSKTDEEQHVLEDFAECMREWGREVLCRARGEPGV